ncbi:MAG TPA: hypothetical protein VGC11_09830 [Acidimicrobiia bacterium]
MSTTDGAAHHDRRQKILQRLDPAGKRALFESAVQAPHDVTAAGSAPDGKTALYSVGDPKPGTVVVECSECEARSRVSLLDVGARILSGSLWLPARRHNRRIKCPACLQRTWCRVRWQG